MRVTSLPENGVSLSKPIHTGGASRGISTW